MCVDVREGVNKGDKFGTKFPLQVIYPLRQLGGFSGVFLLFGLINQLENFAIDLGLGLIALDYADYLLRVRLQLGRVWLCPLRTQWPSGD